MVEGPLMDADLRSFTSPHAIPVRTGMTIGEFAKMVVAERRINVSLTVIPLEGWDRRRWFDETGLPWVNPSPNIRSPQQALLYSGVGLLEPPICPWAGTDMPSGDRRPWIGDPPAWPRISRLALPRSGSGPSAPRPPGAPSGASRGWGASS
jgi:hypothetical protein